MSRRSTPTPRCPSWSTVTGMAIRGSRSCSGTTATRRRRCAWCTARGAPGWPPSPSTGSMRRHSPPPADAPPRAPRTCREGRCCEHRPSRRFLEGRVLAVDATAARDHVPEQRHTEATEEEEATDGEPGQRTGATGAGGRDGLDAAATGGGDALDAAATGGGEHGLVATLGRGGGVVGVTAVRGDPLVGTGGCRVERAAGRLAARQRLGGRGVASPRIRTRSRQAGGVAREQVEGDGPGRADAACLAA